MNMVRSRNPQHGTDPEVEVFIPLTRMNFVAFVDAGLIAAPRFLRSRQHYEDVLSQAEDVLVGFAAPVHDSGGWVDTEDVMNFPVVVQVAVPGSWIADSGRVDGKKSKRMRGSATAKPLCIRRSIPLDRLIRVHTPGPITAELLKEDPFLENTGVKVAATPQVQNTALSLLISSLNTPESVFPTTRLEQELRCVAAIAACATAIQGSNWDDAWRRFRIAEPFVTSSFGYLTNRTTDSTDRRISWLPKAERFFSDLLDSASDTEVIRRCLRDTPSSSLQELDYAVIVALGRVLMNEGARGSSVQTSITKVRELLNSVASPDSALIPAIDRIRKGLELAESIATGVRNPEDLFNPKTEWAHSVRACGVLLLRDDISALTCWKRSEKPNGALTEDLYLACVFAGLHVGYTRLPRAVKGQFSSLLYLIGSSPDNAIPTVRELRSNVDDRGQWQLTYMLTRGCTGIQLSVLGDSASLWAAFKLRFGKAADQPLARLLVSKIADVQIENGEVLAKISRHEGKLTITFDAEQVIETAKRTNDIECLRAAAVAFDGEFGLTDDPNMLDLMTLAEEVLLMAENAAAKRAKSPLALQMSRVMTDEAHCFGHYDLIRRAVIVSRLLTSSRKASSGSIGAPAKLSQSPLSHLF
jgi:hypothetical protein